MFSFEIGKYGEIKIEYFYRKPRMLIIPRDVPVRDKIEKLEPKMRKWLLKNLNVKGVEILRLLRCYENGVMDDHEVIRKMREWRIE